jgi:hypothetical protein
VFSFSVLLLLRLSAHPSQGVVDAGLALVQLTNAGLEICWKRAVRMAWRAGAAKERPASILRRVCVGGWVGVWVYGRGAVVVVFKCAASYATLLLLQKTEQSSASEQRRLPSSSSIHSRFNPLLCFAALL